MVAPAHPPDTALTPGQPARRQRPIATYLVVIALVALVPTFVFAAVLIQRTHHAQEQTLETLVVGTTRSLLQAVERELAANVTTLRVLATTPALEEGDYRSFHARTRLALADTETHLFVLNPDLTILLSTRLPFESELGSTADPASAETAFATGETMVTDLIVGAVSGDWVYNILLPVTLDADGDKVLALNQAAAELSRALLTNRLPEGWHSTLLDGEGRIIAASPNAGTTGAMFTLFDALEQPVASGWLGVATDQGEMLSVIQRSGISDWRLVTWAPRAVIERPLFEAILSLVAGGVLLAALIALALFWAVKRIGTSVRGLARDARRLGQGEPVTARTYPVSEISEVSVALAEASAQRLAADAEVRFLMREVAHRAKNQMTVISAMAKQTARGETDIAHYVQSFERRILGLARSTDLLLMHGRAGVGLRDLLVHQVEPFSPSGRERVVIDGPDLKLNHQAAQILGMAFHELATNAAKYGAFSHDHGRLRADWRLDGDVLRFAWRESHGDPVGDEGGKGFGTTVLRSMVGRSLNAEVTRIGHDDGIEWRFDIPAETIHPDYGHAANGA
jgi:two-component sensor histidine kinase